MKSTLFQEAIADAKAVRATALANAKAALEEAFTPKLQSMLGARLKEELEEDDEMAGGDHTVGGIDGEDDNVEITSAEIDSILKELDNDIKDVDAPVVGDAAPVVGDATDSVTAAPDAEVKTVEAPVMVTAPAADAPAAPAADAPAAPAADAPAAADAPEEEEVNLEELLAELNSDEGTCVSDEDGEKMEEDIDLNELLKSLSEDETDTEEEPGVEVPVAELKEVKEQFAEACKTIEFLRGQLNEVNLLNAKLLYTNKLFKAHALDNTHKMKIIESFDLAKSVREVKLTYNNLSEALSFRKGKTSKKSTIAESFASQSVGTTKPAESIVSVPVNEMASRFQKLAGIKK